MRILKIVSSHDEGGVLSCEMQYIKLLQEKGVQIDLIIVGTGRQLEKYSGMVDNYLVVNDLNIKFEGGVFSRIYTLTKSFIWGLVNARKSSKLVGKYDALMYTKEMFMFYAGVLAQRLHTKCYWQMANTINTFLARKIHQTVSAIFNIIPIANSVYTQSTFGDKCKYVVYPGFDSDRLLNDTGIDELQLDIHPQQPIFGMLARVCHDKAQDILVQGFLESDAVKKYNAHLIIGGIIENESFLHRIEEIAGIYWGKNIHYVGLISNVIRFYETVDIIMNSRRDAEPFGISIAEGLFMKKPVIAYYLGGPTEMIEEGRNGWLVHGTTPFDYKEAINKALHMKGEWQEMGYYAHISVQRFDASTNADQLIAIIEK